MNFPAIFTRYPDQKITDEFKANNAVRGIMRYATVNHSKGEYAGRRDTYKRD